MPHRDTPSELDARALRVALCDGHGVYRRRLMMALEADSAIAVIADAAVPRDLGSILADVDPDVLIVDLASPDGSPLEGIRRLCAVMPNTAILALAGPGNEPAPALVAGARGAVTKTEAIRRGPDVVRRLAAGGLYLDRRAARSLGTMIEDHEHLPGVSSHHLELLHQMSAGRTTRELGPFFKSSAERLDEDLETIVSVLMQRDADQHAIG